MSDQSKKSENQLPPVTGLKHAPENKYLTKEAFVARRRKQREALAAAEEAYKKVMDGGDSVDNDRAVVTAGAVVIERKQLVDTLTEKLAAANAKLGRDPSNEEVIDGIAKIETAIDKADLALEKAEDLEAKARAKVINAKEKAQAKADEANADSERESKIAEKIKREKAAKKSAVAVKAKKEKADGKKGKK